MRFVLSLIRADIYVYKTLNNPVYKMKIIKWVRYVDGILIIRDIDVGQIKEFMVQLKNIGNDIQIKEEIGSSEINYMDLNIRITGNKI